MCEWDMLGDTQGKQSPELQFWGDLILFKVELDSWIKSRSAAYTDLPATKRCLKLPQGMQLEMDKAKENQNARNLQGKGELSSC
jgi:hypothetical protein